MELGHRVNFVASWSHKKWPGSMSGRVQWMWNKLCGRPPQYASVPCQLTFDLLTLKVVSESRVTWATSVPILVFLGLSVLDLGPMKATERRRQTSDAHYRLMPPPYRGEGIISNNTWENFYKRRTDTCRNGEISCSWVHIHCTWPFSAI